MSNTYVKRHDTYLVRWVEPDGLDTHIVHITDDNKMDEALCGLIPDDGWSRRGGTLKVREVKCEKCNTKARELKLF